MAKNTKTWKIHLLSYYANLLENIIVTPGVTFETSENDLSCLDQLNELELQLSESLTLDDTEVPLNDCLFIQDNSKDSLEPTSDVPNEVLDNEESLTDILLGSLKIVFDPNENFLLMEE